MSSDARAKFKENVKDVKRLIEIHTIVGGTGQGYRHQLEVLHKSSIVLTCAFWESYCEDIAAEALEFVVEYAEPENLSKGVRKIVADELKREDHQLAVWKLAGDGWKQ